MTNKLKNISFDKICRTCLGTNCQLKAFTKVLSDVIKECTSVNIEEDVNLPPNICTRCIGQVKKMSSFRKKIEKSDLRLQKLLYSRNKRQQRDELENSTDSVEPSLDIDADNDIINQIMNIEDENITFLNEPPPLVPLIPPKTIPVYPPNDPPPNLEIALKPITNETPPLIMIKKDNPQTLAIGQTLDALSVAIAKSDILVPFFVCPTCPDEFTDPIEYKNHVTSNCSQQNSKSHLICNICKKEFADRNRLIGHLKGHTVQKLYACKVCGKRYPNPSTFKVHMRTHTGERPFKCQVCGKGFIRWAGVVGHMKSHNESKPYQCEICQRGFKMQSNLDRHKLLHSGAMPFCCSYCGKTFTQNDNLQLHVRTYHTNERPYLCNECGKSFVSSTRLKRHMWVHTGFKRYICEQCNKSYSNSNDLKIHTVRAHGGGSGIAEQDKPYACKLCKMRFFHPCRLARHMRCHLRPFECHECMRTFSREDALKRHFVIKHVKSDDLETSEPKYKWECVECDETFETTHDRTEHVMLEHR